MEYTYADIVKYGHKLINQNHSCDCKNKKWDAHSVANCQLSKNVQNNKIRKVSPQKSNISGNGTSQNKLDQNILPIVNYQMPCNCPNRKWGAHNTIHCNLKQRKRNEVSNIIITPKNTHGQFSTYNKYSNLHIEQEYVEQDPNLREAPMHMSTEITLNNTLIRPTIINPTPQITNMNHDRRNKISNSTTSTYDTYITQENRSTHKDSQNTRGHHNETRNPRPRNVAKNTSQTQKQNAVSKLKVLYSNVDSLPNKMHELLIMIGIHRPDIIMITEVLPKNYETKPTEQSLSINGFELFSDIELDGVRGTAVYIDSKLDATEIKFTTITNGNIWCKIKLKNKEELLMGCIYRSPSSINNENTILLSNLLHEVCNTNPARLLMIGDFNYPEIDWDNHHTNQPENHRASLFIKTTQDLFLHQHTTENTRYREGQIPSLLDLVLTNEDDIIDNIQYLPPLGRSDHICMIIETNMIIKNETNNIPRYAYHKGNYAKMLQNLGSIN